MRWAPPSSQMPSRSPVDGSSATPEMPPNRAVCEPVSGRDRLDDELAEKLEAGPIRGPAERRRRCAVQAESAQGGPRSTKDAPAWRRFYRTNPVSDVPDVEELEQPLGAASERAWTPRSLLEYFDLFRR